MWFFQALRAKNVTYVVLSEGHAQEFFSKINLVISQIKTNEADSFQFFLKCTSEYPLLNFQIKLSVCCN